MNQVNNTLNSDTFSLKIKEFCLRLFKRIFDLKNLLRVIELVLLLTFNMLYGKKPFVNWN